MMNEEEFMQGVSVYVGALLLVFVVIYIWFFIAALSEGMKKGLKWWLLAGTSLLISPFIVYGFVKSINK